ncbi:hypothetical protein QVD17_31894 [Tagetes erecta]|uniref:Transposase, Ptta/En/Spm n=1 Tax=Tagetes erecta TaxID=13708 RepID=A0AAD8K726_TARER|nr:hypothetical protein QVD17_31894 [Tagetes erecta]
MGIDSRALHILSCNMLKGSTHGRFTKIKDKHRRNYLQGYYQWEEKWNAQIYMCSENCIAGKFPNLLKIVRYVAKAKARKNGVKVGDDMTVLSGFKPPWIRAETWKQMIDIWNTAEWKKKSKKNSDIRSKSTRGKHTLGSQSYASVKRKAANILGREPTTREMWMQSHCRKGSRPLDKYLSSRSSQELNSDSEGDVQEENIEWVDQISKETLDKYEGYFFEKYGKESSKDAKFDNDLWSRASGIKNTRKVNGFSNVSEPYIHGKHDPEIEKCYEVINELVKEKEEEKEEKERLKGVIAELVTENEAMHTRMTNLEAMFERIVRN